MQKKIRIGKINGILHRTDAKNLPAVIMVHGFGGEGLEEEFEDIAEYLCKNNYSVLRFLFRGYETNDLTDLTVSKEINELKSVIDFCEKTVSREILIIAQSLGCVVSMLLNDSRVKAMVMLAPLIHLKKGIEKSLQENEIKELETLGYTIITRTKNHQKRKIGAGFWNEVKKIDKVTEEQIKAISCPMLLIHGTGDQIVDYRESEIIFEWANKPKELKLIKGGQHVTIRDPEIRETVKKYILDFFLKYSQPINYSKKS